MAGKKFIDTKDSELVEYFLYPELPVTNNDSDASLQKVNEVLDRIEVIAKKLSETYIWHNDEFQIAPYNVVSYMHSNANESEAFSFYGSLNYGENIEDEWFLVYLLVELTKQINGLVVRVHDGDGEFLLIEAAEHLPAWASPETCEDRVFLYNGRLHILPKTFKCSGVTEDVLTHIRRQPEQSEAAQTVQEAVRAKIAAYPGKIEAAFHRAVLYTPVGVAALLNAEPRLIASAIRAFCERDLVDIKACRAMRYFPPENRVLTQVKFTRCLYAMLYSSKYVPDRRTGWDLPSTSDDKYKSHLLGVKAACGFEILLSQVRNRKGKDESDKVPAVDFENDPQWKKFLKSLTAKNYFRGLLEHSKDYNALLGPAKEFYRESCERSVKPNRGRVVSELLDRIEVDVEELRRRERAVAEPDDDSWMNITQRDLDAMLEARFGSLGQDVEVANGNPELSHHLKTFISHVSGLEGAEFPKAASKSSGPARPKRGVKNKKRKSVKFSPDTKMHSVTSTDQISAASNTNKIHFEPDGFINAIQSILDFSIPDDNYWESDGSGMSSYEDEADLDLAEGPRLGSRQDDGFIQYMDEMDKELSKTTLSKSFVTKKPQGPSKASEDSFDDIETFQPVDIDMNALKNIMSSYQAQMGDAGPAENLLGPLGVNLDDIDADVD